MYKQKVILKFLQVFFWVIKNSGNKTAVNEVWSVNALSSDFGANHDKTLVSDQTSVRPMSRPFPWLCPLIRPSSDQCPDHFPDFALWSDRCATNEQTISQTLSSDQTVVRPLSRASCNSSVSQNMYFGSHHANGVRPKLSDQIGLG